MENGNEKDLLLVGGGEFCAALIDALRAGPWRPVGVVDNNPRIKEIAGTPVVGPETALGRLRQTYSTAALTLDFGAGPRIRRYLYEVLHGFGYALPVVIPPLARVDAGATFGDGCIVMPYTLVAEGCVLGHNTVVGGDSEIRANVRIGSNVIIENNVIVSENAVINDGARVGAGAVVGAGVKLGKRCFVAPGAPVFKDIPPYKITRG